MARIRVAKATSGAAFLTKKKETEARLAAAAAAMSTNADVHTTGNGPMSGVGKASTSHVLDAAQLVASNSEDLFELQHHHLLQCLERTTVSLSTQLPLDGQQTLTPF